MEEGDVVLCTVERIDRNIVFVKIHGDGEGTIISSEIAPGRIKYLRQYVSPNKKIVCKVLNISGNNINLSLRRVSSKEKKEVMQAYQQENTYVQALKQILKEDADKIIEKIKNDFSSLSLFVEESREDEKTLEKYIPKDSIEKIQKVIDKKRKNATISNNLKLKCMEEEGLLKIKEILKVEEEGIKITYISAGKYLLKVTAEDFKKAKQITQKIIEQIQKNAKGNNCEFEFSEKR